MLFEFSIPFRILAGSSVAIRLGIVFLSFLDSQGHERALFNGHAAHQFFQELRIGWKFAGPNVSQNPFEKEFRSLPLIEAPDV
ncbi:hypothetical protein RJ55_08341 [Drechmeria coniospora]|nr:hypothetical protein RJ55_08341 [Drechmeria coniospora]